MQNSLGLSVCSYRICVDRCGPTLSFYLGHVSFLNITNSRRGNAHSDAYNRLFMNRVIRQSSQRVSEFFHKCKYFPPLSLNENEKKEAIVAYLSGMAIINDPKHHDTTSEKYDITEKLESTDQTRYVKEKKKQTKVNSTANPVTQMY